MTDETNAAPGQMNEKHDPEPAAAAVREAICRLVAGRAAATFGGNLRAAILIGSVARNEATIVTESGIRKLLGDAEFLLAFEDTVALPDSALVARMVKEAEDELARQAISVKLDCTALHSHVLGRMQPNIYTFEVRTWGDVVWGDTAVLQLIPAFAASDIPLEDAFQLLCNRMTEVLECAARQDTESDELSPELHYRLVKLYQDMATSFLVAAGEYEPTYRGRAERLAALAKSARAGIDMPLALKQFSARVSACTRYKLEGKSSATPGADSGCPATIDFLCAAVADAHALWRWELIRLTCDQSHLTDDALMIAWGGRVRWRARMRGWGHVCRKLGWSRSLLASPRWLRLAIISSPRYCVYTAASELFFSLPAVLCSAEPPAKKRLDVARILSNLPVVGRDGSHGAIGAWRAAIDSVCWNYDHFLKDTRS